jgi:hypothetical protein
MAAACGASDGLRWVVVEVATDDLGREPWVSNVYTIAGQPIYLLVLAREGGRRRRRDPLGRRVLASGPVGTDGRLRSAR